MVERWKSVTGFDGSYEVSDQGVVRSLDRTTLKLNRWGTFSEFKIKGHVLKTSRVVAEYDYRHVSLYLDGKQFSFSVYRLVANAFVPNPENLPEINHKNGDADDDVYTNLEWVTHVQNMEHAHHILGSFAHLRKPVSVKKDNFHFVYPSVLEASKYLGVQPSSLTSALKRGYKSGDHEVQYV